MLPRKNNPARNAILRSFFATGVFIVFCCAHASALTRWSANHIIPDADFLETGQFVADIPVFAFADSLGALQPRPGFLAQVGIMEWVNIEAGYSGGFTLGLKARLLTESGFIPSLALGVHNIISHQEINYFNVTGDSGRMTNEVFLALGKNIEPIKTRVHLGIQTIPSLDSEMINPFAGIEKYLGAGLYATLELHRRHEEFVQSLFFTWRTFRRRLELSAGVVGISKMLFNDKGDFAFSLYSNSTNSFVKPGIWLGLRYLGNINFGSYEGLKSVDDRLETQRVATAALNRRVDTLSKVAANQQQILSRMDQAIRALADSVSGGREKIKMVLLDKLIALKTAYQSEPYDPEKVRTQTRELLGFRERALPYLQEEALNKTEDRFIRVLCVRLLGDMGNMAAANTMLDLVSQTGDPELKIELIIALGKLHETRASYLLEQLANDPNDAVAFTAQEVLDKMQKQDGIRLSKNASFRPITFSDTLSVAERKIETGKGSVVEPLVKPPAPDTVAAALKRDTTARPAAAKDSSAPVFPNAAPKAAAAPVDSATPKAPDSSAVKSPGPDAIKAKIQRDTAMISAATADTSKKAVDKKDTKAKKAKETKPKKEAAPKQSADKPSGPVDFTSEPPQKTSF